MKDVLVLGVTGSIGSQTVKLISQQKENFRITEAVFDSRLEVFADQLKDLPFLKKVGIKNEKAGRAFKEDHPEYEVVIGEDAALKLASEGKYDKAVNALVGADGFEPSLAVLKAGKDLCLANKESLVIGGELIEKELKAGNGQLFAIDSEHVALAKLLAAVKREEISRLIITASGGSLRDIPLDKLKDVSPSQVLNHPTWKMGTRITIDSATMVNKGFEFIEAHYLYDWPIEKISVVINDESQVHSALEMKDNSYLFEVGPSDMMIPISYALNEGRRVPSAYKKADFERDCSLHFRRFDPQRYPLFQLVLDAFAQGGSAMAFLNAVDEEAVEAFSSGQLSFPQMISVISSLVRNQMISFPHPSAEDIIKTDSLAREKAKKFIKCLDV